MKSKNNIALVLFIVVIVFFLYSCAEEQKNPPYLISNPEVKIVPNPGVYTFCGIEFVFYNTSKKEISRIDVSCYAYSATDKKNVLSGSNKIEASFSDTIPAQGSKRFAISLDSRLYCIPEEPFIIDFFTIPTIHFSDGSVWTDPICQFYTGSN